MSITTDPITPMAPAVIAHMNNDHADALLDYARNLAGLAWAQAATIVQISRYGLDLHVQGNGQTTTAHIPFDPPLTDAAQLRPTLIALAQESRPTAAEPAIINAPQPEHHPSNVHRLFNIIATRRSFSLKDLSPRPIDLHLVAQMLDAANWAPSHGKTEPWRFVVYSGDAREIIGNAFGTAFRFLNQGEQYSEAGERTQRERVWQVPVWIALGMHPNPKMPEWEELIAFGSAVQNAQLMASALGLASKWTSGACALHPHVAEVVGFFPETRLYGFLYAGWPAIPWPTGNRRSLVEKVRWISEISD